MKDSIIDYPSLQEIEKYLGYSIEEESFYTNRPIQEINEERTLISEMHVEQAKMELDKKRSLLQAVTTTEAGVHYGMSPSEILKLVRKGVLPGFKRKHGHWRVWINPSSRSFLKWNSP